MNRRDFIAAAGLTTFGAALTQIFGQPASGTGFVTYEVPAPALTVVSAPPAPAPEADDGKKKNFGGKILSAGKSGGKFVVDEAKKGVALAQQATGTIYAEIVPFFTVDNVKYYIQTTTVDAEGNPVDRAVAKKAEIVARVLNQAEFDAYYSAEKATWPAKPIPKPGKDTRATKGGKAAPVVVPVVPDYQKFPVRMFEKAKPLTTDDVASLLDMLHGINAAKIQYQHSIDPNATNVTAIGKAVLIRIGACDANGCADLANINKVAIPGLKRDIVECIDYQKEGQFSQNAASGLSGARMIEDFRSMTRTPTKPLPTSCPAPAAAEQPKPPR